MTITIENADDKFAKTISEMANLLFPKSIVSYDEYGFDDLNDDTKKAIKQVENGETEVYESFEEFKKAMNEA